MARKRVTETPVVVSSAAAAPARRKVASPKRTARPAATEVSKAPVSERKVSPAAVTHTMDPIAFRDAVARLAYSYWEARGCKGGSPEADWIRAERELRAK